jgi:hypothetical protein
MRRLVLEFSLKELDKFSAKPLFENVKSFEILRVLKYDPKESAAICRVELEDENVSTRIENLFPGEQLKAQLLEQEGKIFTYLIKGESTAHAKTGGYFDFYELRDGKLKIGFMGDMKAVKTLIALVEKKKIQYRLVSLTDAKVALHSPLNSLTEKQRRVLITAFESGYYDLPRKITSMELARKLGLRSATLVEHRRKAERRVLAELLKE